VVEVDKKLLYQLKLPIAYNTEKNITWTVITENRKWFEDDILFLPIVHLFL